MAASVREQLWDDDDPSSEYSRKMEKLDPSLNEGGMLEVISSFSIPFNKDTEELREHLQEAWPTVKAALKKFGVKCTLSLEEGSMAVSTTRKTCRDPDVVVKARDLMCLLSRSVPAHQALKILSDDDIGCDIIKIGNLIRNRKRFALRRDRILGPNMSTLQAIEAFTGCYMLVKGSTVSAMGSFEGLKQVGKIVEACMKNTKDPISYIQELRTKLELEERQERKYVEQLGVSNDESSPQKKQKS